ncbi:nucleoside-diphosphate-sugar epimerase [Fusarium longipes]|uniref:Nucleoside-diphosphate-sugar epimerase n=1 Tax=Fusarium longipes TaxID=694270 RepID=A0A395S2B4_9HYPO|nr:nucleoside-diphosphate-sugar epimerase [Fusarium longipes]
MHLILTGATGLVGSSVLDAMLKSKEITKISILSRRPVPLAEKDSRVNTIIHKDFTKYEPQILDQLQGANGVVWALGISQLKLMACNREYVTITREFPLAAAEALSTLSPTEEPFRFIYVSAYGATTSPGTFTSLFGRVKGEAERKLSELRTPKFHVETLRPCHVDAANHDAIKAHIPNPGMVYNTLNLVLGPIIRTVFHSLHSPTERLGPFLTAMAMGKYDKQLDAGGHGISNLNGSRILDNVAFQRLYRP